jgi:hypothetical protein
MKLIDWWGRGVCLFLYVSIVFLGLGRVEVSQVSASFSSWSISRTAFFSG